jgi:hypothetical protein
VILVSDSKALAEIQTLAARNFIRYSSHARKRMSQRGATAADVRKALLTATAADWQVDHQTWHVTGGTDTDGDDLTCNVAIEADVVVVTIT